MRKETAPNAKNIPISITGIVVPVDWDEKGSPKVVAISTDKEEEFIVNPGNKPGKALQDHLRQRVKVYGLLHHTRGNRIKITVKHFTQMEYDMAE